MTAGTWIQLAIYALGLAAAWGALHQQVKGTREKIQDEVAGIRRDIARLEVKQDKHNGLVERMAAVEQSTKSAHKRLDTAERRVEKLEDAG